MKPSKPLTLLELEMRDMDWQSGVNIAFKRFYQRILTSPHPANTQNNKTAHGNHDTAFLNLLYLDKT